MAKQKKQIAIQGYAGSFHHAAAEIYFGKDIEVLACNTFRELFKKMQNDDADAAVVAIENSIAGSILPNYMLLQHSNLLVTGELYLLVDQCLLAAPGVKLKDIREVHSHPMALLQCMDFLDQHHWKLVETEDTALSARHIADHRLKNTAAIASSKAADLYHLNLLESSIQTEKENYTRFLVLEREAGVYNKTGADKASVFFEVDHQCGSLARILSMIASCGVNLSKLQSVPVPERAWTYAFHVDMEFEAISDFNRAIDMIKDNTSKLIIYGVYSRGNKLEL